MDEFIRRQHRVVPWCHRARIRPMKPIPLEVLERVLGPKAPAVTVADSPFTVSEAPAKLLGLNRDREPVTTTDEQSRNASHIVDITDQYIGKSLIITGTRKLLA
jgi:hypothetical protein